MPQTNEGILLVVGVVLFLFAIISGKGIKIYGLVIPPINTMLRIVLAILGLIFIVVSFLSILSQITPIPVFPTPPVEITSSPDSTSTAGLLVTSTPTIETQRTNTPLPHATSSPTVISTPTIETPPTNTPTVLVRNKFRLCNIDDAGDTFFKIDPTTGIARVDILPSVRVFFIGTEPATITFSPNSDLLPISSDNKAHYVILGKNVPGLEWIEINPGYSSIVCIYSLDQLDRAKNEADNDMKKRKDGNNVSIYYLIEGRNVDIIESFPPTPSTPTSTLPNHLTRCSGLASGETIQVAPNTFISGDIVIDGIRQHDYKEKEGTVAYFQKDSVVFAEWGASCYQGDISLLSQVIQGEYKTGCTTGCTKVRSVIVHPDGQQEVLCRYPNGTTAKLQSNGSESWCP